MGRLAAVHRSLRSPLEPGKPLPLGALDLHTLFLARTQEGLVTLVVAENAAALDSLLESA